jgi:hypothetical protein
MSACSRRLSISFPTGAINTFEIVYTLATSASLLIVLKEYVLQGIFSTNATNKFDILAASAGLLITLNGFVYRVYYFSVL